MPLAFAPPPAIISSHQTRVPPFKFLGFQLGMPLAKAEAFVKSSGGNLSCQTVPGPTRLECAGKLSYPGVSAPVAIQLASVADSITLIVLTARTFDRTAPLWVSALRTDYGPPKEVMTRGVQESWEWSRGKQVIRIVERRGGKDELEASLTMGSAPLPEKLGQPQ